MRGCPNCSHAGRPGHQLATARCLQALPGTENWDSPESPGPAAEGHRTAPGRGARVSGPPGRAGRRTEARSAGAEQGPLAGLRTLTAVKEDRYCRGMSNAAGADEPRWAIRLSARRRSTVRRRALIALEMMTGAAGLAGGVLLAAAPDGSLLRADRAVLAGTPFSDWRVPGVLLAGLVGGGFLLAGWWQWRGHQYARELSMAAGAGGAGVLRGRRAGLDRIPAPGSGVRGGWREHRRARLEPAQDTAMTTPSVRPQLAALELPT